MNENPSAENSHWDIVTTKNISASGILLNYYHYLEPGTRVKFKISIPVYGVVDCVGEVVRNVMGTSSSSENSTPKVHGVAAVFRDVDECDQKAMREFFWRLHAATG